MSAFAVPIAARREVEIVIPEIVLPWDLVFRKLDHFKRWHERILLMAGSRSQYLAQKQVEEAAGGVAWAAPATIYLGLWTAALSDTSTGSTANEAAYTSYARASFTNDQTTGWNAASLAGTATVTNKTVGGVSFPTSTGGTSTVTYLGILDASAAGNLMWWTDVTSVTINNGDTPKVNAGAISIVAT